MNAQHLSIQQYAEQYFQVIYESFPNGSSYPRMKTVPHVGRQTIAPSKYRSCWARELPDGVTVFDFMGDGYIKYPTGEIYKVSPEEQDVVSIGIYYRAGTWTGRLIITEEEN